MPHKPQSNTPLADTPLANLRIPAPSADAALRVMQAARAQPPRGFAWLRALRQIRAGIYLPQSRYIIMASMVGAFILVGLIHQPLPSEQLARHDPLFDVAFDEEGEVVAGLWVADVGVTRPAR